MVRDKVNRIAIEYGGEVLENAFYWSLSMVDLHRTWRVSMQTGIEIINGINNLSNVRAVRRF